MSCSNREIHLRSELPIVAVLGAYRRGRIVRDALTAVTICAVLVPQALAYGQLASLSPVNTDQQQQESVDHQIDVDGRVIHRESSLPPSFRPAAVGHRVTAGRKTISAACAPAFA